MRIVGGKERYGVDHELDLAARRAAVRVGLAIGLVVVVVLALIGVLAVRLWLVFDGLRLSAAAHGLIVVGVVVAILLVPRAIRRRRPPGTPHLRPAAADHPARAILDRLSSLADMEQPRLALVPSPVRNAFVVMDGDEPTIALTSALADALPPEQLEAVLAHELFHVAHGDVRMTRRLEAVADARNTEFVVGAVRDMMRQRELAADRAAALLTGRPQALAAALQSCTPRPGGLPPLGDLRAQLATGFVAPYEDGDDFYWHTHPTLGQRVEVLSRVATSLGTT